MRQHPVLLALMLMANALITILKGSCSEDPVVNADVEHQILPVSNATYGEVSQQRGGETFINLVEGEGYVVEEHSVTTEDDYVLSIHRIPGGPKSPVAYGKQPVILIHGLLAASDIWVLRGRQHDLAYLLVDNGYDVWAINSRGNYYSKRHKYMSTKEPKFWRFSWHEFGTYDTAASIDYILSLTEMPRVSLVGHSMGGTAILVLLSKRPEYNDKVHVALTFAPVAIITHNLPGIITMIATRYGKQIKETLNLLGTYELFPRNEIDLTFSESFCQESSVQPICKRIAYYMLGLTNLENFDLSMLPRVLRHYPQGTSIETLLHYVQIAISGKFTEYDFGPMSNYLRYKSLTPPEYPLENVTAPVILYYGPNDLYTTKKDIEAVSKKIPNAISKEIPYSNFGHLDFIFLNESKRLLYDDNLEVLNGYKGIKSYKSSGLKTISLDF